jgi:hypothetical protein
VDQRLQLSRSHRGATTAARRCPGFESRLGHVHRGRRALASQAGRKPAVFGLWRFDSIPTHRGRIDSGAVRCWFCSEPFKLADAGSIPVRVTLARCDVGVIAGFSDQPTRVRFPSGSLNNATKWWNRRAPTEGWSARRLERRALGRGSSTLPLVTIDCRWAGVQPAFMRPARPDRYRDLQLRVGQCSVELHELRPPGATPGPATAEYANWQSDEFEKLVILQVRLLPRSQESGDWSPESGGQL